MGRSRVWRLARRWGVIIFVVLCVLVGLRLCIAASRVNSELIASDSGESVRPQDTTQTPAVTQTPVAIDNIDSITEQGSVGDSFVESQDDGMLSNGQVEQESAIREGEVALQTRLIIKEGTLVLVVDDTQETRADIQALVARYSQNGGYVVDLIEEGGSSDRQPSVIMIIRVPAVRFDDAMAEIVDMAQTVVLRSETAQDVTDEYFDLQQNIESLEAARERLLEFLSEAETTADLLTIEAQLTARDVELDALRGQSEFLADSAALSLISIQLMPAEVDPTPTPTFTPTPTATPIPEVWRINEAVEIGTDRLVGQSQIVAEGVVIWGISRLPFVLLTGLSVGILLRILWGFGAFILKRANLVDERKEDVQEAAADSGTDIR